MSAPARDVAIKYWLAETEPHDSLLQAFMAQGHWSKASAESLCRQLSDAGLDDIEDMLNYMEANWAAWFDQVVSGYICFKDAVKIQRVLQHQALHLCAPTQQQGNKLQEREAPAARLPPHREGSSAGPTDIPDTQGRATCFAL